MATTSDVHVPIQARSVRTRKALLAAARAEFESRGYAGTTAKSIAAAAGTGTGTFYRYFTDKDAALRELTRERAEAFRQEVQPLRHLPGQPEFDIELARVALGRVRELVRMYVDYHRRDRGIHAVITERRLSDPTVDEIMTASEQQAVRDIERTLADWGYEGDAAAAAFMWFSLLEGAVHSHVLGTPVLSEDRFVDGLTEALMRVAVPRSSIALAERL